MRKLRPEDEQRLRKALRRASSAPGGLLFPAPEVTFAEFAQVPLRRWQRSQRRPQVLRSQGRLPASLTSDTLLLQLFRKVPPRLSAGLDRASDGSGQQWTHRAHRV